MSDPQKPDEQPQPPASLQPVVESAEIMRIKNDRALAEFDDPFSSAAAYRHFMTVAETFSRSIFVPTHFQGKPGDCLIALNLAKRMDEDPLQVMQNIFVVGGRPGFYTSFMIARANRRARFQSKIRWTVEKLTPAELPTGNGNAKMPNMRVTASAVDEFGELIEASVDTDMAIAEGWPKNPKYRSMPEHMLKWRAAAFLIRLYAPEVMMGMPTIEEVETTPPPMPVVGTPLTAADILTPAMTIPSAPLATAELPVEFQDSPEMAGRRGKLARQGNHPREFCPYPAGSLADAWTAAWEAETPISAELPQDRPKTAPESPAATAGGNPTAEPAGPPQSDQGGGDSLFDEKPPQEEVKPKGKR